MEGFLQAWNEASVTTLSYFWKAFWAFCLGYLVSGMIQVFVTRRRMQQAMGTPSAGSVGIATFFGFVSSSCSFSALATTRALFAKGAGLIPSLSFLLASTNLVIELGVMIAIFLGWQFIVGEYVGGVLLILVMIAVVSLTRPTKLVEQVREQLSEQEGDEEASGADWRKRIRSMDGWAEVGSHYAEEWMMVWKDVTVGFTVAGIISVFVPRSFFEWLFVGTGQGVEHTFLQTVEHVFVGPLAAFFTFIGSMGNIPLAAVLFGNGVSFAGVMAFIFSDLIVFPVLRMNAKFYGWKMALYIAGVFLICIVVTSLALHWGFAAIGQLPDPSQQKAIGEQGFELDYTFWLNLAGAAVTIAFAWLARSMGRSLGLQMAVGEGWLEKVLFVLAILALAWLVGGVAAGLVVG